MQQRTRRLVLVFGASAIASVGLILGACSTDLAITPLPGSSSGGIDSGKTPKDTGASSSGGEEGEQVVTEAGVDCGAAPTPRSNTGVFCFGGAGSDDAGSCDPTDDKICCADAKDSAGAFIKSKCAAPGGCGFDAGSGGREWHCTDPGQCQGNGEVCCVTKGTTGSPKAFLDTKDFPGCGNYFNKDDSVNVGGSRCRANDCQAGELMLCAKDSDCTVGKCRFFKLANRFSGICKE